jgi:putative cell wall-binding protein
VVVANGAAFADALSASALAGSVPGGAPILLTTRDALPTSVAGEITRLDPATVYIVGGTGVVSEAVEQVLEGSIGETATVVRLAGSDRFATSREVVEEIITLEPSVVGGRVIVVNAFGAPDAVVSSPLAYAKSLPVIMVRTDSVPQASADAIEMLAATQALVVGGPGVVADGAITALGIPAVRVASGSDRYDTAAKLALHATSSEGLTWATTTIASGQTLVDALSGGPFAGEAMGPMLLTRKADAPVQTWAVLDANSSAIDRCYLLGGTGAITEEAQHQLEEALQ